MQRSKAGMNILRRRWQSACAATIGKPAFWKLAVDHITIKRALEPLIETYATGRILDLGAGRLAWRSLLSARGEYVPVDLERTHPGIVELVDVQQRFPFADASFDTVFCCSVLEHVPSPWQALSEVNRVLRPGGYLILSLPFMYHIHGAPHDYWRFSPFAVQKMAKDAGLEVASLNSSGGIAHTVLHPISILSAAFLWHPAFQLPAQGMASALSLVARVLDGLGGQNMPQSVNAVLRRPLDGVQSCAL